MVAIAVWQSLLDGLGWCMAQVYSVVPNYALTIIIVTVIIRLLLLPFGFKQIKSMQHMQALQPKIKELQKKYKSNKQKQQEETMKLYKEAGVNPLGGCLPMLLTLPFLFAMYAVIRPPALAPAQPPTGSRRTSVVNNHLPSDSTLFYRRRHTPESRVPVDQSAVLAQLVRHRRRPQGQHGPAARPWAADPRSGRPARPGRTRRPSRPWIAGRRSSRTRSRMCCCSC